MLRDSCCVTFDKLRSRSTNHVKLHSTAGQIHFRQPVKDYATRNTNHRLPLIDQRQEETTDSRADWLIDLIFGCGGKDFSDRFVVDLRG